MNSQREAFEQWLLQYNTEEAYLLKHKSEYNADKDSYYNKKHPDLVDEVLASQYHSFKKGWQAATEQGESQPNNDSRVEWTGPSVKVKDVGALINSDEMQEDLASVDRLRTSGAISSDRCRHGIRYPHECDDCVSDIETDVEVAANAYEYVAEILEPYIVRSPNSSGFLPDSVVESVQILLEYRLNTPAEQGVGEAFVWVDPKDVERLSEKPGGRAWVSSAQESRFTHPLYTNPPKPTGGGVPDGWTFKKQRDSILVQFHENREFIKGRWIDKSDDPFIFDALSALLATQQPPEQD